MSLQNRLAISIHFTVTDERGLVLETTENNKPFSYLQGAGYLPQAIEAAIDARNTGEEFTLLLSPEDAYGYPDDALIKELLLENIAINGNGAPIQIGDCVDLGNNDGHNWIVYNIHDDKVYVNANHPWSGETILMQIKIIKRRPALDAEINKGVAFSEDIITTACDPGCCC